MNPETKNCQNCKHDFTIEPEDFAFYDKIKVPPPTWCPECRLQRRLVWMIGLDLFKRKCGLCGEMKLSMYAPDAPYVVYCDRCWWSDNWDARDFAREYDPSQNFFKQWNDLLHETPLLGLSIDKVTSELSPYTNHCGNAKNCYLIYYSDQNEDSAYGFFLARNKNVCDSSAILECENCYDCRNSFRNYNVVGSVNSINNIDSTFLQECDNCTNCFGSANLRNKQYVFFNERLSEEEYQKRLSEIDLGSYKEYQAWKAKVHEHWKKFPPKPNEDDFSFNSTGSYYFHSKNCKECYEVEYCEDSKFLMLIKTGKVQDSYDYTDWGLNATRLYECMTVGENVRDVRFCHECGFNLMDIEYSKLQTGGAHNFGCVSMKKGEYYILNKQYSEEEYYALRSRIIEDMNESPYISAAGHTYRYGEFFPPEFSPHAYNNSFASRLFPLPGAEVVSRGLHWLKPESKDHAITMKAESLPDHIKDAPETIVKEIIECTTCTRGFRIIPQELQFLRKNNLPLPRRCPFCRIWEKVDEWVLNMQLHERICDTCGVKFRTHYSKERTPAVLCKECYIKEVV